MKRNLPNNAFDRTAGSHPVAAVGQRRRYADLVNHNGIYCKPLQLDPKTPARVRQLVQSLEDHFFRDVHTMLRLPEPDRQLTAGCNFAITQVLAAVVSGVSVTLYSHTGGSGARFKALLKDFYPWSLESGNTVTPQYGADVIYSLIRNPLTHDLGLDLEKKRKTQKVVIKRLTTDQGQKWLPENVIERLEGPMRLVTMSPTVTIGSARTVLLVEAFYWGVRKMVENLSHDGSRMLTAKAFLASI